MTEILLVEDEKRIAKLIAAYLEQGGYTTTLAFDGKEALRLFETQPFDLIILDLMLPLLSGEEVCRSIRAQSTVPILMLTAKTDLEDKLTGFRIGADDYLSKPFEPEELIERVHALLRRSRDNQPKATTFTQKDGTLVIHSDQLLATKDGRDLGLTANEFKILRVLLAHPNRVYSREEIIEYAFGQDYEGFDRAIDTHIKNIRAKMEDNPRRPQWIKTIYGMGYKIDLQNETP